jgi:hypothetical protein
VFPYTTVWLTVSHTVLVGSTSPSELDHLLLKERIEAPEVRSSLDRTGLAGWVNILSRYLLGPAEVEEYAGAGVLNTDDHPRVEFSEQRSYGRITAAENLVHLSFARERAISSLLRRLGDSLDQTDREGLERSFAVREHALKGRAYWLGNRLEEGLQEYLKAWQLDPGDREVNELAGPQIAAYLRRTGEPMDHETSP